GVAAGPHIGQGAVAFIEQSLLGPLLGIDGRGQPRGEFLVLFLEVEDLLAQGAILLLEGYGLFLTSAAGEGAAHHREQEPPTATPHELHHDSTPFESPYAVTGLAAHGLAPRPRRWCLCHAIALPKQRRVPQPVG